MGRVRVQRVGEEIAAQPRYVGITAGRALSECRGVPRYSGPCFERNAFSLLSYRAVICAKSDRANPVSEQRKRVTIDYLHNYTMGSGEGALLPGQCGICAPT
jgi:hypothetical protein